AVLVGVAQVKCLAHAMVAGAVERDTGRRDAVERIGKRRPGWIQDRRVEQSGGAGRRRTATLAFPGVETDVVGVAAGRYECGARSETLLEFKAKHVAIEAERAIEIGDFQMYMPDPRAGYDGWIWRHGSPPVGLSPCSQKPAAK